MVWLQTPPWARWILSALIAAVALWVELGPDPTVPHPFAIVDIEAGDIVDETNTESRRLAAGILAPVVLGRTASLPIPAGDPILATNVGDEVTAVPEGWWVMEVSLPRGARSGDEARIVLLDSGDVVEGRVVGAVDEDPLGSGLGMVAVDPAGATEAAVAAAEGRIAIMIATG
jgi:hypothetical protein